MIISKDLFQRSNTEKASVSRNALVVIACACVSRHVQELKNFKIGNLNNLKYCQCAVLYSFPVQ